MAFNVSKLFITYFLFDFYSKVLIEGEYKINFILLTIAVVASLIGSTVQATHLSLKRKILYKDLVAIYSSGVFIAYLSYELGYYYNEPRLTGLSSAIFSYISIEFIIAVKNLVLYFIRGISKKLPDAVITYFLNNRENNNNSNDNNQEL